MLGLGQLIQLDRFIKESQTLGNTARYRTATQAEAYYLSLQYENKKSWDDKTVPLKERKPRIVIPLPRKIIEQVDRFIWSGNRAPKVIVEPTIDTDNPNSDTEIGPLLDPDQSKELTTFVDKLIRQGKLFRVAREYTNKALITTSCTVVIGVQEGYLNCYVHGGKDCTPKFMENNPRELESIEIKYQYPKEESTGVASMTQEKWYWYRRIIDIENDTVYQEEPVISGIIEPEWKVDKDKTVKHNLGFCPAIWVRTFGDCDDPIDGKPLIDPSLYPLFDAINYTVSQKQRAVEYGCDPQPWRQGVPVGQREALAKNPGVIWDLPADKDSKIAVGFLEANGTGVVRAADHLKELEQSVREVVGIIDTSPEMRLSNISGAALEQMYAPMIALTEDLRFDLGNEAFVGLLNKALRLVSILVDRGEDVWIPGVKRISKMIKESQVGPIWVDLPLSLQWAPFFPDSQDDVTKKIQSTIQAQQAGIISKETATRFLASSFNFDDYAGELEKLEEEEEDQKQQDSQENPNGSIGKPVAEGAPEENKPGSESNDKSDNNDEPA